MEELDAQFSIHAFFFCFATTHTPTPEIPIPLFHREERPGFTKPMIEALMKAAAA